MNIEQKELDRDLINLHSDKDGHIPLVEWEDLEKIYGKEFVEKQKKRSEDAKQSRSSL